MTPIKVNTIWVLSDGREPMHVVVTSVDSFDIYFRILTGTEAGEISYCAHRGFLRSFIEVVTSD